MSVVDWAKIHLLEQRERWWRGKAATRRRELDKWKITGDRAHYWYDKHVKEGNKKAAAGNLQQIESCRKEIGKWSVLVNEAEREIHALEKAIAALKPKTQTWPLGGLVAPNVPWWDQRWDEGKDFEIVLYTAVRAPGNGHVVEYAHDRPWPDGFGDPYLVIWLDDGPFHAEAVRKGVAPEFYVGHCNAPLLSPGEHFTVGTPMAQTDHSLNVGRGWCEFGHWLPGKPAGMGEGELWKAAYAPVTR